jgi:hypothetical protein
MAFGDKCKNCGWQKSNHDVGKKGFVEEDEMKKSLPGFRYAGVSCPGYEPRANSLSEQISSR